MGLTFTYRDDGKLKSIAGNGGTYAAVYDPFGRCVRRIVNGVPVYYTYDGAHAIYEWKADGTRAGWNLYGQGIDEILLRADYQVVEAGQGYFFQQNRIGSVTQLTGFSGEPIEQYRYDAFGQPNTTGTFGVFNNRFKFTGREYLEQFGIYDYRNRAYHPGLGRFLSEDPMGLAAGDTNMYRYCGGDPVNWSDPFGLRDRHSKTTQQKDGPGGGNRTVGPNGTAPSTPGWYQETPNGLIPWDPNNAGNVDQNGWTDRVLVSLTPEPLGDRPLNPGDFGGSDRNGSSPSDGTATGRRSGAIEVQGWPTWLTLPAPQSSLPPVDWHWNGITITDNTQIAPGIGIQLRLGISPKRISFRYGIGPGVGNGFSVTTGVQSGKTRSGWNWQGSVSGGYGGWGGAISGNIWAGPQSTVSISGGYGTGFGATFVPGYTIVVEAPWASDDGG